MQWHHKCRLILFFSESADSRAYMAAHSCCQGATELLEKDRPSLSVARRVGGTEAAEGMAREAESAGGWGGGGGV